MRCQLGAGIVSFVRARALVLRNAYSSVTRSRTTARGFVMKGRVGDVHAWARLPSGSFHRDHQPGSAGRNSKPESGAAGMATSRRGNATTQEMRLRSPSVV